MVPSNSNDILRWKPSKDGLCTTKAAYYYLSSQQVHQIPSQGARSITTDATSILHKVWKCKLIPLVLKTFAWRLIRRALATGARAGTFSIHINKNCDYCGHLETDQHLFFTCNTPAHIWSIVNTSIHISHFPLEDDGVQLSLSILFQHDSSEKTICNIMFIL